MAHRFQFFVDAQLEVGDVAQLSRDDLHHLATIRAVVGDIVDVVDTRQLRFEAELLGDMHNALVLRPAQAPPGVLTDAVFVHVYVGSLSSGQRWDALVDACVQTGADAITPLVQNPRERDAAAKRIERGARIAKAAAQQAKRLVIPTVNEPLSYRDLPRSPAGVVLDLNTSDSLMSVDPARLGASAGVRTIPIVVGGAEGLPDRLVDDLVSHGWQAATLGPNVLRAGLAAAVATSVVRQLTALRA